VFDLGPAEVALAAELWTVLEPEAREIAMAIWQRRERVYGEANNWAAHDKEKSYELAAVYLRNLYTRIVGLAWVESAERTVALAYSKGIALTGRSGDGRRGSGGGRAGRAGRGA